MTTVDQFLKALAIIAARFVAALADAAEVMP